MKHVRMSGRFLAALLALLMVLSTVIALPVVAEEGEASSEVTPIWFLDMSQAGALDATATNAWLKANNGFALKNEANSTNVIDADGFYMIKKNAILIDGATEPNDFFNLFYGLYDGYNTVGATYDWAFDFRFDAAATYARNDNSGFTYTAADGTPYTELWTDESGWSFFAALAGGNYDSIFRVAQVGGVNYLYAESAALTVTNANYKEIGNVYFKDANGKKISVAEDGGSITETGLSIANVCDVNNAYKITVGEVYAIRVRFEILGITDGKVSMKAHLYVKGAGDAKETYLGFSDWTYNPSSSNQTIRLSDSGGIASVGNMRIGVNVWEADLNAYANVSGATDVPATLKDSLGVTVANANARLQDGLLEPYNGDTKMGDTGTGNTFYNLLTGTFTSGGETLDHTFVEFDYKFGSDNRTTGRTDTTTTIAGTANLTAVTDYGDNGGANWNFRFSGSEFIFRVSPNNYLYTEDLATSLQTVNTGIDGYVYYTDATHGKLYFDAKGYRYSPSEFSGYTVLKDGKYYLDDPAGAAPTVSGMSLTSVLNPAKRDQAYRLEEDTLYRIGLDIRSTKDSSTGKITVNHTVYVKKATSDVWEKCVGTSSQVWASGATISFTGATGIYYGGNMVGYTYTCGNGQHLDGMCTTVRKFAEGGAEYYETSCMYCGYYKVTKDGVAYNSQTVQNGCGGSHTLWTAADGSGKTFKTDVVASNHNYNTAGYCENVIDESGTKCGDYSWYAFPASDDGSYIARTTGGKDYDGDGKTTSPAYSAAKGYVEAPESNMIMRGLPSKYVGSPYIFSMDFCIDKAIANPFATASSTTPWTLFSYRSGVNNTNTYGNLVGVALDNGELYLTGGLDNSRKVFKMAYDTWYNIQIVCDPVSKYCAIYVDGEYVDAHNNVAFATNANSAAFVIGLINFDGPHTFAYRTNNMSFTPVTLETLFGGADASNTIFTLRYDDGLEGTSDLGGETTSVMGSYSGNLSTNTETVGLVGGYAILNTRGWYPQFTMSHVSGTNEFTLSDKKYEIKLEFAVPNTDAYGAYTNGVQAEGGDGLIDALQYTPTNGTQSGQQLVRLSKYADAIQSVLVSYTNEGNLTANGEELYYLNGEKIDITCEFVNGIPTSTTDLRVVVDEKNNVYSVYVNNEPAYYLKGEVLTPYLNMKMPCSLGSDTTNTDGTVKTSKITEVDTYGEVTKAIANEHGYTGTYHYCRVLRNMWGVAVKEISLTLIPDSNAELVGVQMRNSDNGAADRTFDLRVLFGLDDLYVHGVGYKVKAYKNGEALEKEVEVNSNLVFKAVNVGTSGAFHSYETSKGDFLSAIKITGIEETTTNVTYTLEIRPYTVTAYDTEPTWSNVVYIVNCNGLGGDITITSRAAE